MNLTFFGLCLACMGVSLGEGLLIERFVETCCSPTRYISELRSLMS